MVHRPRWYPVLVYGRIAREIRPSGSTRRFASNRPWLGIIAQNYTFRRAGYVGSNVSFYATTRAVRHPRDHRHYLHMMALSFELPSNLTIEHVTRYRPGIKRFVENWSVLLLTWMMRSQFVPSSFIYKFKRDYRTSALVTSNAYDFTPTFIFILYTRQLWIISQSYQTFIWLSHIRIKKAHIFGDSRLDIALLSSCYFAPYTLSRRYMHKEGRVMQHRDERGSRYEGTWLTGCSPSPKMESHKPLVSLRERFELGSPSKAMPRKPSTSLEIDARRRI